MMRTSATGRAEAVRSRPVRRAAEQGFTLVELLIVMTIIGLMSAAVVLAIPDGRGSLVADAERFAARAHAAQEQAILDGRPIAIRLTGAGYGFDRRERGEWKPIVQAPFGDSAWSEGTQASIADGRERVVFDTTGAAEPLNLVLLRDNERVRIEIAGNGKARVAP